MFDYKKTVIQALPFAVTLAWIITTICAFWWFQFRHLGAIEKYSVEFNSQQLREISIIPNSNTNRALVIHIIDNTCPCSRFSTPHIVDLERKFESRVEFKTWDQEIFLNPRFEILASMTPVASPAVVIWDKHGELAYYGPYSSGSFCGQGEDLVQLILDQLQLNVNPKWINHNAIGCFCRWKKLIDQRVKKHLETSLKYINTDKFIHPIINERFI